MKALPKSICGKPFGVEELEVIQKEIHELKGLNRSRIAERIAKKFKWLDITGKPKLMGARKALLQLHRNGQIELPPPRNRNGNGKPLKAVDIDFPPEIPIEGSKRDIMGLRLDQVVSLGESRLFNALVSKYHYLGYKPLPGAQIRYLIHSDQGMIGGISFGASAWKVADRDRWIGWNRQARERKLFLIMNNTRFLILPWVKVKNLASHILSVSIKKLVRDIPNKYGYCPVLLETFVDSSQYKGTCYQASNWIKLGQTKGRGKCDQYHKANIPIKDIYVYPLKRNFRRFLGVV